VCDRENGKTWFAAIRMQDLLYIERLTFHPTRETWRCEKIIQRHRQFETVFGWKERLKIHDADLSEWWRLDLLNQTCNVKVSPGGPLLIQNV